MCHTRYKYVWPIIASPCIFLQLERLFWKVQFLSYPAKNHITASKCGRGMRDRERESFPQLLRRHLLVFSKTILLQKVAGFSGTVALMVDTAGTSSTGPGYNFVIFATIFLVMFYSDKWCFSTGLSAAEYRRRMLGCLLRCGAAGLKTWWYSVCKVPETNLANIFLTLAKM